MLDLQGRTLGERIREIRADAGSTQVDFAFRVGVTPTQVSRWERGTRRPRGENLRRIAAIGGIPVQHLTNGCHE